MDEKIDLSDITIICPNNDGESKMIIKIANRLKMDVRVSTQSWGSTLDKEPKENLKDLKNNLVIIEMPNPRVEKELSNEGYNVVLIDHHKMYGLDRTNSKSSLEQFAELLGYTLNKFERGIAINDRGYIYSLLDEGYTMGEIIKIREYDLQAQAVSQGINWNFIKKVSFDAEMKKKMVNGIYITYIPTTFNMYLLDLVMFQNPTQITNLVIISTSSDGVIPLVQFFGNKDIVNTLYAIFGGFMGGGRNDSGFWGITHDINLNIIFEKLGVEFEEN